MKFNSNLILVLVIFLGLSLDVLASKGYNPQIMEGKSKPKLVVNIIVGQMRYDYLLRFADNFQDNGFLTMVNDGVVCRSARHDYLYTSQASGLTTIMTGSNPSTHGVVGDGWYDYNTGLRCGVVDDKGCYAVGADEYDAQVSPRNMVAGTLGDALKSVSPLSKVVSVALQPMSSVLTGGFSADAAYWVNPKTGAFISSTYYMNSLADWVQQYNNSGQYDGLKSQTWTVSMPIEKFNNVLSKDIVRDTSVSFFSFDFMTKRKADFQTFSATPWANTMVKDFAINAIIGEALGQDNATDLLNITFDASRNIGQQYGTQSVELEDSYYRLDKDLAHLFGFLDEQFGRDNVLVVLSSDHGAVDPTIESSKMPSGRFNINQFAVLMNGFLGAKFGSENRWILDITNNQVYLNRRAIHENKLPLRDIQNEIADFAIQFRGVANAITSASLHGGSSVGVMQKAQNGYFPRRSGDVILNFLPGWSVENDNVSQAGSGYSYDVHIPLMFCGAGVEHGVVRENVEARDVAPTISVLMGIAPPNAATGRSVL